MAKPLKFEVPSEFIRSATNFTRTMGRFLAQTKKMQAASRLSARTPVDISRFSQLNTNMTRYENYMSRTVDMLSRGMGPFGRLLLNNFNVEGLLSQIPESVFISRAGVAVGPIGVVASIIAAMVKKTISLAPSVFEDYMRAMGLGTDIASLRAFELTFGRYGFSLAGMRRGVFDITSQQYTALRILRVSQALASANSALAMAQAIRAAQAVLKGVPERSLLDVAHDLQLTSLMDEQQISQLRTMTTQQVDELATKLVAKQRAFKLDPKNIKAFEDLNNSLRNMGLTIRTAFIKKLTEGHPSFIEAMTKLTGQVTNFSVTFIHAIGKLARVVSRWVLPAIGSLLAALKALLVKIGVIARPVGYGRAALGRRVGMPTRAGPMFRPGIGPGVRPGLRPEAGVAAPGYQPSSAGAPAPGAVTNRIAEAKAAMEDQLRKEGVPEANIKEAANLLAGQAISESNLNPNASHDQGTGYGIYGARLGRRDAMLKWMKDHNYPPNSLEGQSRYMAHEAMSGRYPATRRALTGADPASRRDRTNTITREFEAPRVINPRTGNVGTAAGVSAGTKAPAPSTTAPEAPARPPAALPGAKLAPSGQAPNAVIIHHTSDRHTAEQNVNIWRGEGRGIGAQFIVDRDGTIHDVQAEFGYTGTGHIHPGYTPQELLNKGIINKNVVGIEVTALNDKDVTPAQREAVRRFMAKNYPDTPVYGHGEVNPGHREADEGKTIVEDIRRERETRASRIPASNLDAIRDMEMRAGKGTTIIQTGVPGRGGLPPMGAGPATNALGEERTARFANELKDPDTRRLLAETVEKEVGSQGPEAAHAYMETVFNRAASRNRTLRDTINDYSYYQYRLPGNQVSPARQAQVDGLTRQIMRGSNVSNYATGNESGTVQSAGVPVTRDLNGERFVREEGDKRWVNRQLNAPFPATRQDPFAPMKRYDQPKTWGEQNREPFQYTGSERDNNPLNKIKIHNDTETNALVQNPASTEATAPL